MSTFSLNQITSEAKPYLTHQLIKPVFVGVGCAIADNWLVYNMDKDPFSIASSVTYGISAGLAVVASSYVAPSFDGMIPLSDTSFYNGKTLSDRIVEVGLGTIGTNLVNSILGKPHPGTLTQRVIIFALSDMFGEYVADLITGEKMSYFQ